MSYLLWSETRQMEPGMLVGYARTSTAEGIAKAKGEGKFKGRKRKPELMPEKIKARLAAGETHAQIAKSLKVARSSVYRVVAGPRAA